MSQKPLRDNPTAVLDAINANLPDKNQFPAEAPPVRTCDDTDDIEWLDRIGDVPVMMPFRIVVCCRVKHPELKDAQVFFNTKRRQQGWKSELPIFRTARWWCKRVR